MFNDYDFRILVIRVDTRILVVNFQITEFQRYLLIQTY